ncbi:MAG: universal stress protein [Jatrophihabitantaceae bacterium]
MAIIPAGPPSPEPGGRTLVVLGLDRQATGRAALLFALEEARCRHGALACVRAWGEAETLSAEGRHLIVRSPDQDRPDELLLGELSELRRRFRDVPVEQRLVPGAAVDALLEAASEAQLLVLGSGHSEHEWSSHLGPIPADVIRRSPCPLIIVGPAHT